MKCWKVTGVTSDNIKYNNYIAAKTKENAIANFEVIVNEKFIECNAELVVEDGMYKILGTNEEDLVVINSRAQLSTRTVSDVVRLLCSDKLVNKEYLANYLVDRDSPKFMINKMEEY